MYSRLLRKVFFILKTNVRKLQAPSKDLSEPTKFDWKDPFKLDTLLYPEEIQVRERVRECCQNKLLPRILIANRYEDYHGKEVMRELGEAGALGCTIQGYECPGVSTVAFGLIAREIDKVDSGYRTSFTGQTLAMDSISAYGSHEQKGKYLPELAKGKMVASFGLTEPDFGSDVGNILTKARHDKANKKYILNGHKKWITNAPIADVFVIWAKLDDTIRGFIAERDKVKGLETPPVSDKFAIRVSPTGFLHMSNVEIPEENLLPASQGLRSPLVILNNSRYGVAWGAMGAAEVCLSIVRQYVLDRSQFDRALGSFQLIQTRLADMITEIAIGLLACLHVGRLKDKDMMPPEMISLIKRNACDKALNIAREARDILGGNGITDEFHVIRHLLNLEAMNTYEGTFDIHGLILGRAITGIPAFT